MYSTLCAQLNDEIELTDSADLEGEREALLAQLGDALDNDAMAAITTCLGRTGSTLLMFAYPSTP